MLEEIAATKTYKLSNLPKKMCHIVSNVVCHIVRNVGCGSSCQTRATSTKALLMCLLFCGWKLSLIVAYNC